MATDDIERLHYYQRQYLGALDFEDQQAYHRDMRRRLNLAHTTWGIVAGLELQEIAKQGTKAIDINITPGMAIDGYGREIVMFLPTQLDVSLFQPYRTITHTWTICIEYIENYTQRPRSGYEQYDLSNQFGRVSENFRIVLANPNPFRDDISVAGNSVQVPSMGTSADKLTHPEDQPILPLTPPISIGDVIAPYDESIPYQEFPIDDPATLQVARWFIPLGNVKWDGSLQSLVHDDSDPTIHETGRRYIGSVASRLLAPAGSLIVRDRNPATTLPFKTSIDLKNEKAANPPAASGTPAGQPQPLQPASRPDGVEMIVEGTLEVDRTLQVDGVLYAKDDIQIHGGALDFRNTNGDAPSPFTISRKPPKTAGGIDTLLLQIGNDHAGNNRFVVGAATDLFTIDDSGKAQFTGPLDVKTDLTIEGILDFGNQPRQMINLWSSSDNKKQNGIGIVTSGGAATTYFRSSSEYWWFKGSVFTAGQSDPGAGAQVQLKLDVDGSLHFDNDTDAQTRWRQMLNLSSTGYGIGVQDSTLYFRSGFDFCWYLKGIPSQKANDPGTGGALQMKLDRNGDLSIAGSLDLKNSLTLAGTLDFGSQPRQMITLWTSQDKNLQNSIGIQAAGSPPSSATTYFRSSNDFYWFKGGSHNDQPGNPGSGKWLMKLDDVGGLSINGSLTLNGGLNFNGPLAVNGNMSINGLLNVSGNTNLNGLLAVNGPLDVTGNTNINGPLVVNGPSLEWLSTTNHGFSVTLGTPRAGVHGSDSIYGVPNLWLDTDGVVIVKQSLRMSKSNGAAFFSGTTTPQIGQVVVLDTNGNVTVSSTVNDPTVVGVAIDASDTGFILTNNPLGSGTCVALMGIVQCNVDATTATGNGAINVGDLLSTSNNPGHAQKADVFAALRGAVLGKAMAPMQVNQTGTIPILIMQS